MRTRAVIIAALAISAGANAQSTGSLPAAVMLKVGDKNVDRIVYGDRSGYACARGELKQYNIWQVVQGFDPGSTDAIALYCGTSLIEIAGDAAFLENWSRHGGFVIWDDRTRAQVPLPSIRPATRLTAGSAAEQQAMIQRLNGTSVDLIRRGQSQNLVLKPAASAVQPAAARASATSQATGFSAADISRAIAQSFYRAPAFERGRGAGVVTVDDATVSILAMNTGHRFSFEVADVACKPAVRGVRACRYRFRFGTQTVMFGHAAPAVVEEWMDRTDDFTNAGGRLHSIKMDESLAAAAQAYASQSSSGGGDKPRPVKSLGCVAGIFMLCPP